MRISVFEGPGALTRDTGWLRAVQQYDRMPDGYGGAFWFPHLAVCVAAPFPLNVPIGWAYRLYWWLHRPVETDTQTMAYRKGFEDGRRQAEIYKRLDQRLLAQDLGRAVMLIGPKVYRAGAEYGWQTAFDAIKNEFNASSASRQNGPVSG